jgi:hypothetical protein
MLFTLAGAITAIALACGSSSSDTSASGGAGSDSGAPMNDAAPSDATTGDAAASSSGSPGDASADAGTSSGSAGNAFTDAAPYTPMLGPSTLRPEHQAAFGTDDPAKHNCSDCHLFAAAGSVFTDATGTTPVAMAEVRLRSASNGNAISTYTDANGNFFIEQSSAFLAGLQFPFQGGVRTDAGVALMMTDQNDGSCNNGSCHGGSQGWAHGP